MAGCGVSLNVHEMENYSVLSIEINRIGEDGRGVVFPDDLKCLDFPPINQKKGVVIDGAAPIWLHSCIAHKCHSALWVAHNDPRIGLIVVQSHCLEIPLGLLDAVMILGKKDMEKA